MIKHEAISSIMTRDLHTLNLSNSLEDAGDMFKKFRVRHLPVVSDDQLVGMLSLTDLQKISFADSFSDSEIAVDTAVYQMLSVEQIMVSDVVKVESNSSIKEVAEILATKEFHALPVMENGKLVGIVTTTDLINFMVSQF